MPRSSRSGGHAVAFCLGGNLYGASPDASFSRQAIGRTDMTVYMSTSLNTGHASGLAQEETIILPVLARDEARTSTQKVCSVMCDFLTEASRT